MKTMLIIILSFITLQNYANDSRYVEVMKKTIEALYQAQTPEQLQQAINTFARIGASEKEKWEPSYYASFGYVLMATKEGNAEKKDKLLDQATEALVKAKEKVPEESEVVALEGFIYTIRLTVDPASRGQKYSGLATQSLMKAVTLNPENPRALSLLGQMQFGTAQFFGSSTEEACGNIRKGVEKFDVYQSENELAPLWGKDNAVEALRNCK